MYLQQFCNYSQPKRLTHLFDLQTKFLQKCGQSSFKYYSRSSRLPTTKFDNDQNYKMADVGWESQISIA